VRPSSSPVRPAPPRSTGGGFVLLEVLLALVIFTTLVLAWGRTAEDALATAHAANADRTLRMLTSRKLSEVRATPAAFKEGAEGGFEEEDAASPDDPFAGYSFSVETEEVVAAGSSTEDEAVFVFDLDRDADPPAAAEGGKVPEPVRLLRFTVTVTSIEANVSMRAVTYAPIPEEDRPPEGGQ